ncbi:protein TIFY 6B-like isoform X4 [Cucumis melo var. makuwa]|uniref:Protein TIFY 6B-like isoform X4 n=1 Tax=Cucumis melo var. makuwa TaxID=1194695 RepID=A0A5D3BHW5_CUCMM|nr:protein TIFY 6B-like isoform X4 [Cucumis melo var. makuwa]
MEMDFLGLSSKKPLAVVKQEIDNDEAQDSGYGRTKGRGTPRVPTPPSPPGKDKFDDDEKIKIEIDESFFAG